MKTETNSSQIVTDAISNLKNARKAIVDAEAQFVQDSARLDELLLQGDLKNETVLTEIGRLNIFVSVHPRRLLLQQNAAGAAETKAFEAVETFKKQTMIPACRELKERMRVKVETELRPHFGATKEGLATAVQSSSSMRELENLSPSLGIYGGSNIVILATNILNNWERIKVLQSDLSGK
jgi:hypothetical protein